MNSDNGWEISAQAWIEDMERGDPSRVHLLDPVMLDLCALRPGLCALDVGCGEGRFCRMLKARGVTVTGIDPTQKILAAARERDPEGHYLLARAEELPFEKDTFDLVISYLILIDIVDFRGAIHEMARVLRPGGKLVVAHLTLMATAFSRGWWCDEVGYRLFWTLDDYMTERAVWMEWRHIRVINWHRPLSAYMQAFLATHLVLEHYDEPLPTPEQVAQAREFNDYARKPDFTTMRWTKPNI